MKDQPSTTLEIVGDLGATVVPRLLSTIHFANESPVIKKTPTGYLIDLNRTPPREEAISLTADPHTGFEVWSFSNNSEIDIRIGDGAGFVLDSDQGDLLRAGLIEERDLMLNRRRTPKYPHHAVYILDDRGDQIRVLDEGTGISEEFSRDTMRVPFFDEPIPPTELVARRWFLDNPALCKETTTVSDEVVSCDFHDGHSGDHEHKYKDGKAVIRWKSKPERARLLTLFKNSF